VDNEIRYLTRPDGVRIAYAIHGDGPPLVRMFPWGHLEAEWEGDRARRDIERLSASRTLIRYDPWGTGMSERDRTDFSLEGDLLDLEALVDHLGLDRFAICGLFLVTPIAVTYAARHPERVTDIVLMHAFAGGETIAPPEVQKVILDSIEAHWGLGSRNVAMSQAPGQSYEDMEELARWNRLSVDAVTARAITAAAYERDVRQDAQRVRARTLIVHRKSGPMSPISAARELASLIPDATLRTVEGGSLFGLTREFLGDSADVASAPITVLVTDRESSTKLTQELGDEPAHELQRAHDRIVRDALRSAGGKEVKHTGDGIMATFASPSAAIGCAVAIQRALADRDDIAVRIGLAAGEVVAEGGDIFGSTVQLACRVRDRAKPGQILVPEAVRQLAGVKGFRFGEPHTVALKGFTERIRLYDVAWEEHDA
jgi:class 3 adenylate cyclase